MATAMFNQGLESPTPNWYDPNAPTAQDLAQAAQWAKANIPWADIIAKSTPKATEPVLFGVSGNETTPLPVQPVKPPVTTTPSWWEEIKSRAGAPGSGLDWWKRVWEAGMGRQSYYAGTAPQSTKREVTMTASPGARTPTVDLGLPDNFYQLPDDQKMELLASKGWTAQQAASVLFNPQTPFTLPEGFENQTPEEKWKALSPQGTTITDSNDRILSYKEIAQITSINPFQILNQVSFLGGGAIAKKSVTAAKLADSMDINMEAGQQAISEAGLRNLGNVQQDTKNAYDQEIANIIDRARTEGWSPDEILPKLIDAQAVFAKTGAGSAYSKNPESQFWNFYDTAQTVGKESPKYKAQQAEQLANQPNEPDLTPEAPERTPPPKWWKGEIPSLQQWGTIPWAEREQLRLYFEDVGISWQDFLEAMARSAPQAPSWSTQWTPARSRIGA